MQIEPSATHSTPSARRESEAGYGWISIALHWLTVVAVFALLFVGDSISESGAPARRTHTTIAVCAWLVLALRITWRLHQGHPPPASGQMTISFRLAILVHYLMLTALGIMLVSGPLMAWSAGWGIEMFEWRIAGASPAHRAVASLARTLHVAGASTLTIAILLHVAGAMKHMFLDRDGSFDRIMIPTGRTERSNTDQGGTKS